MITDYNKIMPNTVEKIRVVGHDQYGNKINIVVPKIIPPPYFWLGIETERTPFKRISNIASKLAYP